jgi:uncharacterized protein YllA (UPF0747 family)
VSAVAAALGASVPLAVPRWSATIVEPHVRRALDRLGIDVDDLADPHAVESRLARAALPDGVRDGLAELRRVIESGVAALTEAEGGASLVSPNVVDGTRRQLLSRVERLERRYAAAMKRHDERTARDVAIARGALYPFGKRQERALNAIPLLARHGTMLWERLLASARVHADAIVATGRPPRRPTAAR